MRVQLFCSCLDMSKILVNEMYSFLKILCLKVKRKNNIKLAVDVLFFPVYLNKTKLKIC